MNIRIILKIILFVGVITSTTMSVEVKSNNIQPDYWNISINQKGICRITYTDLTTFNINPEMFNLSQLGITYQGEPVPYYSNKSTGLWKQNDFIEFFGKEPQINDSEKDPYTKTNVYQLYCGTTAKTKYFQELSNNNLLKSQFKPDIKQYISKERFYWDIYYRYNSKDHQYPRIWYSSLFKAPTTFNQIFTLPNIDLTTNASSTMVSLRMVLQGESRPPVTPNHHTIVKINSNPIANVWWSNVTEYVITTTFSLSLLTYNLNTLTIELPGDIKSNPPMDQILLAGFDLVYPRRLNAHNDEISAQLPVTKTSNIELCGFSNQNISIYNLTDNTRINPYIIQNQENKNLYNARFSVTGKDTTHIYAVTEKALKHPTKITPVFNASIKLMKPAEYVILTHDSLATELENLVKHRKEQGYSVAVIKISDIYNEFNYGRFSPEAIKAFTKYAYANWKSPKLKFLFIVGDANWDYLDAMRKGVINYVPTYTYTYFASDHYYAVMDTTNNKPAFAIGRLPAKTSDDVKNYVNKLLEYETATTNLDWTQKAVLVAGYEPMFTTDMDQYAKHISPTYKIVSCYAQTLPEFSVGLKDNETRDLIQKSFSEGAGLVAFVGHGTFGQWSDRSLLTVADITTLKSIKIPVVLSMTCYTGRFEHETDTYGIGELLVKKPNSGSVAFIGSTGRSSVSSNSRMLRTITDSLINKKVKTIGEALLLSKMEMSPWETDQLYSYVLLGDPALQFKSPMQTK